MTGSWAFLNNDDNNNYRDSRKRKHNNTQVEENAVIAIGDDQNLSTKRNPKRQYSLTANQLKSWAHMFDKLVEYKKHHGHTMVPRNDNEYKNLGTWIKIQRYSRRNGCLLESRFTLLNSIDFVWEDCKSVIFQEKWMNMYQQLVVYKNTYKTTRVPQSYKGSNNTLLSNWVSTQRQSYKNNKMLEERYVLLDSIDFVWDDTRSIKNHEYWMKMYQQLVIYKNKYKSTHVPQIKKDGNRSFLGSWVNRQRHNYKKNKLLEERYDLLHSIDFVWDTTILNAHSNDNHDDDNVHESVDNDDDDEEKPAAVVSTSTQPIILAPGDVDTGTDVDVNVNVHQSKKGTRGSISSSNTARKRPSHCYSNRAIRRKNIPRETTKENGKEDGNNTRNDYSFDKDDDDNNDNGNNNSFYNDWNHGNWCWL